MKYVVSDFVTFMNIKHNLMQREGLDMYPYVE